MRKAILRTNEGASTMHLNELIRLSSVSYDTSQIRGDRMLLTIEGPWLPEVADGEPLPEITLVDLCEAIQRGYEASRKYLAKG